MQGRLTVVPVGMPMMRVVPTSATMLGFYSADSASRQVGTFLLVARFWLAMDAAIGDVVKLKKGF